MSISGAGKKPFVAPSGPHKQIENGPVSTGSKTPAAKLDELEENAAAAVDKDIATTRTARAQAEAAVQARMMASAADTNERKQNNYQALKDLEASPEGQALMKFMKELEKNYPQQYVNLAAPGPDYAGGASIALTSHGVKVWENYDNPEERPLKGVFQGIHDSLALISMDSVRKNVASALEQMELSSKTGKPPPEFGVNPNEYFEHMMHGSSVPTGPQRSLEDIRKGHFNTDG
jgi:hypothetical protein